MRTSRKYIDEAYLKLFPILQQNSKQVAPVEVKPLMKLLHIKDI